MQLNPRKMIEPIYWFLYDLLYHSQRSDFHKHAMTSEKRKKSVEEAIYEAHQDGCRAVMLTDHDTIGPVREFLRRYYKKKGAKEPDQYKPLILEAGTRLEFRDGNSKMIRYTLLWDMAIIAGVELSTKLVEPDEKPRGVHLLAAYVPWNSEYFNSELHELYTYPRNERLRETANKIQSLETRVCFSEARQYFTRTELATDIAQQFSKQQLIITPPIDVPHHGSLYEHLEEVEHAIQIIQDAENKERALDVQHNRLFRLLPDVDKKLLYFYLRSKCWEFLGGEDKAFVTYLHPLAPKSGFVAYESMQETQETIRWVKEYGAGTVIAHPSKHFFKPNDKRHVVELFQELADLGLIGLEVWTHKHTPEMITFYSGIAKELDLIMTGGSDDQRYELKAPISVLNKLSRKLMEVEGYQSTI